MHKFCYIGSSVKRLPIFLLKLNLTLTLTILKHILNLIKGGLIMSIEIVPDWMINLDDEDISFIKKFIMSSGSLKEIAKQYNVTYPTVRLRLDKLIQKIQISEDTASEPYISLIKRLAVNEKVDFDTAKILINEYKKLRKDDESK